jgi:hypothetical protein
MGREGGLAVVELGLELCESGCRGGIWKVGLIRGDLGWWEVERGVMRMGKVADWRAVAIV